MKYFIKIMIVVVGMMAVTVMASPTATPLDGIVATVNEGVVTQSELEHALTIVRKDFERNHHPLPDEILLRHQVLEQLINRKLQMQLAVAAGIKITDADVEAAITHLAILNKVTPEQFNKMLIEQGFSQSSFRKEIKQELMIQQLQQHEIGAQVKITPQEVANFMHSKAWQAYNQSEYRLEDILIALPDNPSADDVKIAEKQAKMLINKLKQGLAFEKAAVKMSSHDITLHSEDLGWRTLAEIPTAFMEEVSQMQLNDIRGPIRTSNGLHIIKLAGIHHVSEANPSQAKQQAEQLIYQRKVEETLQTWLARLRSQAYIVVYDTAGHPNKDKP